MWCRVTVGGECMLISVCQVWGVWCSVCAVKRTVFL